MCLKNSNILQFFCDLYSTFKVMYPLKIRTIVGSALHLYNIASTGQAFLLFKLPTLRDVLLFCFSNKI